MCVQMLMHTLSKFLCVYGASVVTTSISYSSFGLTNVVESTISACESIEKITRITSEMVTDLKVFSGIVESYR